MTRPTADDLEMRVLNAANDPWPWPHFPHAEMCCHGKGCCGGACRMQPPFMRLLEMLREIINQPLIITSGYRCPTHNARVSTSGPDGVHTMGIAADIQADGQLQYQLAKRALMLGFTGLGFDRAFVHLDTLQVPPRPNIWTY